jgi:molybdenum cofactor biosynthesis protein B
LKPHEEHRKEAPKHLKVRIVTVSSSRYAKMRDGGSYSDEGGDAAEVETKTAGNAVTSRKLVSDDAVMLRTEVKDFLSGGDDVLLLTGGTGVSSRDITIETVRPFFQKELDGFGELLRRLSFDEIGTAAVLTRATLGVAEGKLIVCLPGSPGAVRTALKAFSGELPHVVGIARS